MSQAFASSVSDICKKNIMLNTLRFEQSKTKTKNNIQNINNGGSRNMLNKWFQDSVKNFIMEVYVAPFLLGELELTSIAEVKVYIQNRLDKSIPKYMAILKAYYGALLECNKLQKFCKTLGHTIENFPFLQNEVVCKERRKQYICLLILTYFEQKPFYEINSFFDLWNLCFPQEQQQTRRRRICKKKKSQGESCSEDVQFESLIPETEQVEGKIKGEKETNYNILKETLNVGESSQNFFENDQKTENYEYSIQSPILNNSQPNYERYYFSIMEEKEFERGTLESCSITPNPLFGRLDESFIPDSYSVYIGDYFYSPDSSPEIQNNHDFSEWQSLTVFPEKSINHLPQPLFLSNF